jgi:hypothetical protein
LSCELVQAAARSAASRGGAQFIAPPSPWQWQIWWQGAASGTWASASAFRLAAHSPCRRLPLSCQHGAWRMEHGAWSQLHLSSVPRTAHREGSGVGAYSMSYSPQCPAPVPLPACGSSGMVCLGSGLLAPRSFRTGIPIALFVCCTLHSARCCARYTVCMPTLPPLPTQQPLSRQCPPLPLNVTPMSMPAHAPLHPMRRFGKITLAN